MKKQQNLTLLLSFTLLIFIFFNNKSTAITKDSITVERTNYRCEMVRGKNTSSFKLKLLKGSAAIFGRENWKKGEKIKIHLISVNHYMNNLEIGILKAEDMKQGWGYNSYGKPITQTITEEHTDLEFTVPTDGQYGLFLLDKNNTKILFEQLFPENRKETVKDEDKSSKNKENNYFTKIKLRYHPNIEFNINKEFKNPLVK